MRAGRRAYGRWGVGSYVDDCFAHGRDVIRYWLFVVDGLTFV